MKRILIYAAAVTAALCASAESLTPAQALARVTTDSPQATSGARRMASRALVDAVPALTVSNNGADAELYMFTPSEGGMLLVSAESETPALIGYSDSYVAGAELPPALKMMIECYAGEIAATREGNVVRQTAAAASRAADDMPAIEPICKSQWNQDSPYNLLCPVVGGYRSVTGCLATAMSQVLRVYEYPAKCSGGTFSYKSGTQTLSLNFDNVTLDWANIADTYNSSSSEASRNAVATLMQAVGYAAEMSYSPYASGANGIVLTRGLVRNFDYDCTLGYYLRDWYPLAQWEKMVYDVLAEGYPVYYDGVTANDEGHAFVVDGYRGDGYFHLNWGWGGLSDGYFLLTALDPNAQGIGGASAGFDFAQGAIFGLKKGRTTSSADAPFRFFSEGGFKANKTSVTLGSQASFAFTTNNAMYNAGPMTATRVHAAVKFTKSDGTIYQFYSNSYAASIEPFYGLGGPSVTLPTSLPEGRYTVTPAVYNGSSRKFYDVYCPVGSGSSFEAVVADGTVTFSEPDKAVLKATDIVVPQEIFQSTEFEMSATITNESANAYQSSVSACLYNSGKLVKRATLGQFAVALEPGASGTFTAKLALENKMVTTGNYDFVLVDQDNNRISDPIVISAVMLADAGELKASDMTVTATAKDALGFQLRLTATDGNFKGKIYIQIQERGNYTSYVARIPSDDIEIAIGATKTVTVTGSLPEGVVGQDYTAYVYYSHLGEMTEAAGRQRKNFTLTEESAIEAVEATAADNGTAEFFDLAGRRVAKPGKGLYLMRQGSKTVKVRL